MAPSNHWKLKYRKTTSKKIRSRVNQQKRNDQPFRFQDLPPEIRVMIYKNALPSCTYGQGSQVGAHYKTPPPCYMWKRGSLAILRVSRQVYHEATAVFWTTNTFQVVLDSRSPRLCIFYEGSTDGSGSLYEKSKSSQPVLTKTMSDKVCMLRNVIIIVPNHFMMQRYRYYNDVPIAYLEALRQFSLLPSAALENLFKPRLPFSAPYTTEIADYIANVSKHIQNYKKNVIHGFSRLMSVFQLDQEVCRFNVFEFNFHYYPGRNDFENWGADQRTKTQLFGRAPAHLMKFGRREMAFDVKPFDCSG